VLETLVNFYFVSTRQLISSLLVEHNCNPVVDYTDKQYHDGSLVLDVLKIGELLVKIDDLLWSVVD